jgi:hypothetical protein
MENTTEKFNITENEIIKIINEAENFEDLYNNLDYIWKIKSNKCTYYSSDLKKKINLIITGSKSISHITRTYGLRKKVSDLLKLKQEQDLDYEKNTSIKKELTSNDLVWIEKQLSSESKKLFYNPDLPKPEYKIQIDWKEFLLTGKLYSKLRKFILWYSKVNWQYEPRFFYFSKSWWNWHCALWIERNYDSKLDLFKTRIAKWEFLWLSYEKWTILSWEITKHFDSFKKYKIDECIDDIWLKNGPWIFTKEAKNNFESRYWHEFKVNNLFPFENESFAKVCCDLEIKNNYSVEDVKNLFKNLSLGNEFDLSFKLGFKLWQKQFHEFFWEKVNIVIWKTIFNWESVDVIFAFRDKEPNLVWIEDIRYSNVKINSHGIPEKLINWWLLTTKPFEYKDQVPLSIKKHSMREKNDHDNKIYIDIRPYIQNNPLIKQFKLMKNNGEINIL